MYPEDSISLYFEPGSQVTMNTGDKIDIAGVVVGAILIYEGVKWVVAAATAAPSGGVSLVLAGCMP